jgi:hypothetical protein
MKRRRFFRSALVGAAGTTLSTRVWAGEGTASRHLPFYELREYELVRPSRQESLDQYFRFALIPALNRANVEPVGVFREIRARYPARVLLIIPYVSGREFFEVREALAQNTIFREASERFNALPVDHSVYIRYTTWLLEAISGFTEMKIPAGEPKVFEWCNYQSYSEEAAKRKIEMFNREELTLFKEAGLSPLFFGKVVAGDSMPSLTYMLSFNSMEERDSLWKEFDESEGWKALKERPEYADTVSYVDNRYYERMSYSQI